MTHSPNISSAANRPVCLGRVVAAHGIKGLLKVESYTAHAADIAAYGPLSDKSGTRSFTLSVISVSPGRHLLARIEGVEDRTAAEALRNTEFFVSRNVLPTTEAESEFYHADLVGLTVEDTGGVHLGRVVAIHNYGAGDVLEIRKPDGDDLLLPFTKSFVPDVDVAKGRLVVAPPVFIEGDNP